MEIVAREKVDIPTMMAKSSEVEPLEKSRITLSTIGATQKISDAELIALLSRTEDEMGGQPRAG